MLGGGLARPGAGLGPDQAAQIVEIQVVREKIAQDLRPLAAERQRQDAGKVAVADLAVELLEAPVAAASLEMTAQIVGRQVDGRQVEEGQHRAGVGPGDREGEVGALGRERPADAPLGRGLGVPQRHMDIQGIGVLAEKNRRLAALGLDRQRGSAEGAVDAQAQGALTVAGELALEGEGRQPVAEAGQVELVDPALELARAAIDDLVEAGALHGRGDRCREKPGQGTALRHQCAKIDGLRVERHLCLERLVERTGGHGAGDLALLDADLQRIDLQLAVLKLQRRLDVVQVALRQARVGGLDDDAPVDAGKGRDGRRRLGGLGGLGGLRGRGRLLGGIAGRAPGQRQDGRDVEHRCVELALDPRPRRSRIVAQPAGQGAVAVARLQILEGDHASVAGQGHLGGKRRDGLFHLAAEQRHELARILAQDIERHLHALELQRLLGAAVELDLGPAHLELTLDGKGIARLPEHQRRSDLDREVDIVTAQLALAVDLEPRERARGGRRHGRDIGGHVDRHRRIPIGDLAAVDGERVDLRAAAAAALGLADARGPGGSALGVALEQHLRLVQRDLGEVKGAIAQVGEKIEAYPKPGQRDEIRGGGPGGRLDVEVFDLDGGYSAGVQMKRPLDPHRHAELVAGDPLDRALYTIGAPHDPGDRADGEDQHDKKDDPQNPRHLSEHRALPARSCRPATRGKPWGFRSIVQAPISPRR